MTNETITAHLNPDQLIDYFEQTLTDDEEAQVELHLATCETCPDLARQVQEFSIAFDHWTARSHGAAYLQATLAGALQSAQERAEQPALRERLRRWGEDWAGRAEVAVRVVLEAPGKTSRIVTEGLEAVARPGGRWQFAQAPAIIRVRGVQRGIRTRGAKTVAVAPGTPEARVGVSAESGDVVVRVEKLQPGQKPPLVLLINTQETSDVGVKELVRVPDEGSWIAQFEGVEPGDYLVAFEPL